MFYQRFFNWIKGLVIIDFSTEHNLTSIIVNFIYFFPFFYFLSIWKTAALKSKTHNLDLICPNAVKEVIWNNSFQFFSSHCMLLGNFNNKVWNLFRIAVNDYFTITNKNLTIQNKNQAEWPLIILDFFYKLWKLLFVTRGEPGSYIDLGVGAFVLLSLEDVAIVSMMMITMGLILHFLYLQNIAKLWKANSIPKASKIISTKNV